MDRKKDLKNTYKEKKFRFGVFQIRNTENNKCFIDHSSDLDAIWNRHKFQLKNGSHTNKELQKEWNANDESTFIFEVIYEVKQSDEGADQQYLREAKEMEKMILEELQPYGDKGYHKPKKIYKAQ